MVSISDMLWINSVIAMLPDSVDQDQCHWLSVARCAPSPIHTLDFVMVGKIGLCLINGYDRLIFRL